MKKHTGIVAPFRVGVYLFLLISHFTTYAQIISTAAGGAAISSGLGDGGPATAAKFMIPIGIVFDAVGNYYIADRDESLIRKVAPDGIITAIAGDTTASGFSGDSGPATLAMLNGPYGIAIDAAGNIYFSDEYNNRVRKINTAGIITTIAGTGTITVGYNGDNIPATTAELNTPAGVAVDSIGNVYFADAYNNRVRKINTSGIIATIAGTGVGGYNGDNIAATNAELNYPNWVTLGLAGNMYITDNGNGRVRMIDKNGIIHTFAGNGIAGYSGDNGPATDAQIRGSIAAFADNIGNVYIGDTYNNVVRKVNAAGIITTIVGNGTQGYSGDGGPAALAELYGPVGIVADGAYNIYVADAGNSRIRRITSTVLVPKINEQDALNIYPNPSDGDFTVSVMSNANEKATITITDIAGHSVKEMQTMTNIPFPVQLDVQPGVYMLYVQTGSGILMEKIVKK